MTHSACKPSLVVVWSHAQGLDKELDSFVDAVLIVQTETTHVQCICISGVHSQNITTWEQIMNIKCLKTAYTQKRNKREIT